MIEGSVHLRFADASEIDDSDRYGWKHTERYLNVEMHWRKRLEDFAIWAVRKYPDVVNINVTVWCETNYNRREECADEFDTRKYCEDIDGPGVCIQDQPEYYWKKKTDGKWWQIVDRQCLDWYYTEEEFPREKHPEMYDQPADFLNELEVVPTAVGTTIMV